MILSIFIYSKTEQNIYYKSANNYITVHYVKKGRDKDIRNNNTIKKEREKKENGNHF